MRPLSPAAGAGLGAAAVAAGAWWAHPLPRWWAALLMAPLLLRPSARSAKVLALVGVVVLASALGARAWAGLHPPQPGPFQGWVTLMADPQPVDAALRIEVRVGRRRAEAWLRGEAAAPVRPLLAGERLHVQGRLGPLPPKAANRLAPRHIATRLTVTSVTGHRPGSPLARAANGLKRTLSRGAASMSMEQRPLFTGIVLGDDRDQSDAMAGDFRAAGLSHLLAVSGQNVAFVLAVAQPLLRRLTLLSRLVAALAIIGLFGTVTRWEPSVLRAGAMAAAALVGVTFSGFRPHPARVLAGTVAALILIDPLLVHSLGFQLSVAACVGIVAFSARVARVLPLPDWLAAPLALTAAAQIGVAPLIIPVFGSVPLVALPANLLAGPIAGLLMGWGLVAGLLAGWAGPPLAPLIHLLSRLLLWALAAIARVAAAAPVGQLRAHHLVAAAVLAAAVALVRRVPSPSLRRLVVTTAAVIALVPVIAGPSPPPGAQLLTVGAQLWQGEASALVLDSPRPLPVLDGLRTAGLRHVDVVVSRRGSTRDVAVLTLLRGRISVGQVIAPPGGRVAGWNPFPGAVVRAGPLALTVDQAKAPLTVRITRVAPGG